MLKTFALLAVAHGQLNPEPVRAEFEVEHLVEINLARLFFADKDEPLG